MSNKKVYLAKHILASGFDVEYVKSSLLRIPGIDIVEAGMGIDPKECVSFVIVSADGAVDNEAYLMYLSKNVTKDLKKYYKGGNDSDTVYIFAGVDVSGDTQDVERDCVIYLRPTDLEIYIEDVDDFNNYASLDLMEGDDFLDNVSADMRESNCHAWRKNPRHPQPKEEYAIPPVPTLEERRLKKAPLMDEVGQWSVRPCIIDFSAGDKRLLLLRRK
jgi:hypothetical protein